MLGEKQEMITQKSLTILGLLAVIGIVMGGISFALAQDVVNFEDLPCDGTGPRSQMIGKGLWAQLSEEQRTMLAEQTQTMFEEGASHDEMREMKTTMLQGWGIDAPQWSGPHYGEQKGGYGKMTRDGSGSCARVHGKK